MVHEALLMVFQGCGEDVFNGLFIKAVRDLDMEDLEEDEEASRGGVV